MQTDNANESGNAPDTSQGAGEAPHAAGAPTAQPAATPPTEATPPPAPETPQPRDASGKFASAADVPLSDIMGRPDVKAAIAKQSKLAAKAAVDEAAAAAAQEAERAKMDEVERLKLEKTEAEQALATAQAQATAAERERDLANTLVAEGVRFANPKALDFVRHQAIAACTADPSVDMGTAVKAVLAEHPYLTAPEAPEGTGAPTGAAQPPSRPSTAPPSKPTQAPAAQKPNEGVDVLKMTPQEYQEYKRNQHPTIN